MKYIEEDIEKILKGHKRNEGRKMEIEIQIDSYQKRLDYAGTVYEDTEQEVIENMQLSGQAYDNIPSNTNKISDKTVTTAMNYQNELIHINKEDRIYLTSEINRLELEKERINKEIVRVLNWLDKIDSREKFVLNELYINNEGKNWKNVAKEYQKEFGQELSIRQLSTIRDKGLRKILDIVNV